MAAEFKIGRLRYNWAGTWTPATAYSRDDVILNDGKAYSCLVPNTSSANFYTDLNNIFPRWQLVLDGKTWRGPWVTGYSYGVGNIVIFGGKAYTSITAHISSLFESDAANWSVYAEFDGWKPSWATNTAYGVNDVVKYGGIVYKCIANHTSAVSTSAGLEANQASWQVYYSGVEYKGIWASSFRYKLNDLVKIRANIYICTQHHTSTNTFDDSSFSMWIPGQLSNVVWNPTTVYQVGDAVIHGGDAYISKTANNQNNYPDTDTAKWGFFNVGYTVRNTWSAGPSSYAPGDLVTRNGQLYEAVARSTGQDPNTSTVTASYVALGSSSTELNLTSITGITAGMTVSGVGFVSGQRVATVVNETASAEDSTLANNTITISSFTSKTGTGPYLVTFAIPTQDIAPSTNAQFVVAGNSNVLYNGTFAVNSTTTASITLSYVNDPGVYGTGVTTITDTARKVLTLGGTVTGTFRLGMRLPQANNAYIVAGSGTSWIVTTSQILTSQTITATFQGITLSRESDQALTDLQAINFVGINSQYWSLLIPGKQWANRWVSNSQYSVGDVVSYSTGTYVCIKQHSQANRPDIDTTSTYWVLLIKHDPNNTLNNQGDLRTFANDRPQAVVIGTDTYVLGVDSNLPNWRKLNVVPAVYYVDSYTGVDTPSYGITWDQPWKTIKYACDTITTGFYFPNAVALVKANKAFIIAEMYQWMLYQMSNNIAPFSADSLWNPYKAQRDAELIVDAILYDLKRGGNSQSVGAARSFFYFGSQTQLYNSLTKATLPYYTPSLNYLLSLMQSVVANTAVTVSYQTLNNVTPVSVVNQIIINNLIAEANVANNISSLMGIITTALTNENTYLVPSANTGISASIYVKTGTYNEILPIAIPENVSIIGDELRSAVVQPASSKTFYCTQTIAPNNNLTTSNTMVVNSTAGLTNNMPLQFISPFVNNASTTFGGVTSGRTYYVDGSSITSTTLRIKDSPTFTFVATTVVSSNILTNVSNITNLSVGMQLSGPGIPFDAYVYSFNQAINTISTITMCTGYPLAEGYVFVEAYATESGILRTLTSTGNYVQLTNGNGNMTVYAGDCLKSMFLMRNGTTIRNMSLFGLKGTLTANNQYQTARPTGGSYTSLDPGTGPNDTSAWIIRRSPYAQNLTVFGEGATGIKIDGTLHNGGSKSIVSNDYTMVISDGIGIWCTGPGSITEAISVFSYYAYAGYFAESGGRIRAANGNSSYGTFGVISEGFDTTEAPLTGTINNQSQQVQAEVTSAFGTVDQLLKLNYNNAGSNYFYPATNMLKRSNEFLTTWTNDSYLSFTKNNTAPTGYTEAWLLSGSTTTPGTGYVQQSITINPAGYTYTNIGGTTQDGAPGSGATFDIRVSSTAYVVTVNYSGGSSAQYQTGNNIKILGSVLGGLDVVNDLIIVVGDLTGTGISTISAISGTVPAGSNQNYTLSMYVYDGGTSATLDMQAIFSGTTTVTSGISYNISSKTITPYSGTSITSSANGGTLPVNFKAQKTLVAGWYRVWFSINDSTGVNNTLTFKFFPQGANAPVSNTYSIIYGAQLEISDADYTPRVYLETTTNQFTAYANYQVVGAGAGALLSGDEIRSQSVFNVRVTTDSNGFTGGAGYGSSLNTAADGSLNTIQLAATDQGIYNYLGMRVFIGGGTGAGQYGFVTYYNNSSGVDANGITTKTAIIAKETIDPIGVISTTYNATPANNLITLESQIDISQWYINQAVQFIPTYYTTTVTATSIDTVIATGSLGGTVNTISIPTESLAINMPITFGAGDLNVSPGFIYYITQIDYIGNTIQIATSIAGTAIQLTPVASTSQVVTFPRYSGHIKAPTTNMVPNIDIQFTGVALGGVALGTTYYISDIIDADNFTVSANKTTLTSIESIGGSTNTIEANTISLVPCNTVVFSGTIFDAAISPGVTYYISNIVDAGSFNITTSIIRTSVTSTTFGTNLIEITDTTGFIVGQPIIFSGILPGTTFGNIQAETVYYILTINTVNNTITISTDKTNTFTLTTRAGLIQARTCPEPISLGGGTGSMTVTSTGTRVVVTHSVGNISTMNGTFSTSLYGGLNSYTVYYITSISTAGLNPTITVSTTQTGTPLTLTTGVGNMQLVASGWDHINPGTPAVPTDSTSSYFIEPKVNFTDPSWSQTVGSVNTPLTGGPTFTSLAAGNNRWLGLPTSGAVGATSTNGTSWTAITLPTGISSWSDITYGNNYWVALGKQTGGGGPLTSVAVYSNSNGLGWRIVAFPTNGNYNKIVYGNGAFVAISSDSHRAVYSTNHGLTWTQSYLPSSTPITQTGTPVLSTAQFKFGISSLYLDGSSHIDVASDLKFTYSAEDFTVECFVRPTSLTGTQVVIDQRTSANEASIYVDVSATGAVRLYVLGSYQITSTTLITAGAWSHIAVSRTSGVTRLFVNGTLQGTTYTDANVYAEKPVAIGASFSASNRFTGYIDEVRISRGVGRYTATFTPTTQEFDSDDNTMLLMHFNDVNNSTNIASTIGAWMSVAYGNGVFVAINSNGQTGWSVDGATWNSSTLPTSNTLLSGVTILGGGGTFQCTTTTTLLVVGQSVRISGIKSGDGTIRNGTYYISATNGKSSFTLSANLANALSGTNPITTGAGTTTGLTFEVGVASYTGIAYGNNKFVAVQTGYGLETAVSFNGVNWIQSLNYVSATTVEYGQGVFLALNSTGSTSYSSEHGLIWKKRTLTYGSINASTFGYNSSNVGYFVTLTGTGESQGNATAISEGARAQGRPSLNSGVINGITLWETGSNYSVAPTVTLTDYNVSVTATVNPRTSNGTLSNPTFVNRGTGYNTTSTVVSITGDGFADTFQVGLQLIVNNLSTIPVIGSNIQILNNSQVYKVTSAEAVFGTSAPFIQANIQVSPEITNALSPVHNTPVTFRQLYSQCRLTNHDFLLIGTGNKALTNYPFTDPTTAKIENQAVETNQGHVFYTSTDENGNFQVGSLFGVQQATGTVTLSATQFGLTGLETLSLGGIAVGSQSTVVTQFSTDPTFSGNSDAIIPTQRAIRSYLTGRLSQGGANTFTGNLIAGTVSVGGPNFIKSTIANGSVGSSINMISKVYFPGNSVDGNIPALNMFIRSGTKRGNV